MTPDRERIERDAAIILRNLRNGLTEERTAKSITALVLRERAAVWEKAARACSRCNGAGAYEKPCRFCGDSTFEHECVYEKAACPLCAPIRAIAAQERAS